jgi:hypothetical protein
MDIFVAFPGQLSAGAGIAARMSSSGSSEYYAFISHPAFLHMFRSELLRLQQHMRVYLIPVHLLDDLFEILWPPSRSLLSPPPTF